MINFAVWRLSVNRVARQFRIGNHPQEINLGKVDQTWFLDLVLLKGREVREGKSPRNAVLLAADEAA